MPSLLNLAEVPGLDFVIALPKARDAADHTRLALFLLDRFPEYRFAVGYDPDLALDGRPVVMPMMPDGSLADPMEFEASLRGDSHHGDLPGRGSLPIGHRWAP
jgi:hypothetical protein